MNIDWFSVLFCFCYALQITFEGDRTVVEMYKFIKKHAGIPFKLKRQDSSTARTDSMQTKGTNLKDEL